MSLLSPYELFDHIQGPKYRDTEQVRQTIALKEEKLFAFTLGRDFYQDLLDDRLPEPSYGAYVAQAYTTGQVVLFNLRLYRAIQDTTGAEAPTNESYWELYPKFAEAEYNHVWASYIAPALSYQVIASTGILATYELTEQGFQVSRTDYSESATEKQTGMILREYNSRASDYLKLLSEYVHQDSKKELAVFANYLPIKNNVDARTTQKAKRKGNGFHW